MKKNVSISFVVVAVCFVFILLVSFLAVLIATIEPIRVSESNCHHINLGMRTKYLCKVFHEPVECGTTKREREGDALCRPTSFRPGRPGESARGRPSATVPSDP